MSIDYESILQRANELYSEAKGYAHDRTTKPLWRHIESDQVKSALRALVEALNEPFEEPEKFVEWKPGLKYAPTKDGP